MLKVVVNKVNHVKCLTEGAETKLLIELPCVTHQNGRWREI